MKRGFALKLVLLLSIVYLLGSAIMINRDYQDSWILEGLEIPFLFFVVTFTLTFFSEKRASLLVVIAVVGRIVFLMIPNLKYAWFQGVYIDQQLQYSLTSHVVATGSISTQAITPSFPFYAGSPLFHLLFSIFSIILNVSVNDSMKYVPILFAPIFPLLTYAILKKMELTQKNTILRYALFLSSIPLTSADYIVTGTTFGIFLAFIVLFLLVAILQKNDRRYWLVCMIFVIALAAAHSVTSIILTGILMLIPLLQRLSYFRPKVHLRASIVLPVALIALAWLMFPAYSTLKEVSDDLFFGVSTGTTPHAEYIPSTFFQLARADALGAAKTFLVYYGSDVLLLVLTIVGILVMFRMRKRMNSAASFFMLLCGLALAIVPIGALISLGTPRILNFIRPLFPICSGVAVFYIGTSNKRRWTLPLIFASLILLATIEAYPCQPLLPAANVVYKGMPDNVPIGYVVEVNSVYQRQVVSFALRHVVAGLVACDSITRNQITGVADLAFEVAHVIHYNPLDMQQPYQSYNLLIIHVPGKAGIMSETADARNPDLILQTIYNSSVVYTNGESYILAHQQP